MSPQRSRKIITYGYDACHRWAVLRFAGFNVTECGSIRELRDHLMSTPALDAVIMVEDVVNLPREAIVATRSYFAGPLVLFEGGRYMGKRREDFDLCVPVLTRPEDWLPKLTQMIDNRRTRVREVEEADDAHADIRIRP